MNANFLSVCLAALLLSGCGGPIQPTGSPGASPTASPGPSPTASPGPGAPVKDVILRGQFSMGQAADVAAHGEKALVAVSGWQNGMVVLVDVESPDAPKEVSRITGIGYTTDVQFKGDYLFVNHENVGHGIDVYDVSTPSSPTLVDQIGPPQFPALFEDCHNTWAQPDRDLLYCASTTTGEVGILSGAPDNLSFVTSLSVDSGVGVHDVYAAGNFLYVAWLDAGLAIYDITDPSSPTRLALRNYNNSFTHNVWPTADGKYLLTSDEQGGGHMRVWDIGDMGNISQVAAYDPNPNAIIHNIEVVGDLAYLSYYGDGLKIVDVSDPTQPNEVATYDILPGGESGFVGAWGVEPKPPLVFVSGIESGLWVFEEVR